MAEYINRENLDFLNDFCIDGGKYAGLRLGEVFDELATEDVIERSKIDKAIEEIELYEADCRLSVDEYPSCEECTNNVFGTIYKILKSI